MGQSIMSFGAVGGACENCQQWSWPLQLLCSIRDQNGQPSLVMCNSAIGALMCERRWKCALWLVRDLLGLGLEASLRMHCAILGGCSSTVAPRVATALQRAAAENLHALQLSCSTVW